MLPKVTIFGRSFIWLLFIFKAAKAGAERDDWIIALQRVYQVKRLKIVYFTILNIAYISQLENIMLLKH